MTPEEHNLQILMFARVHEAIGVLAEMLKSRDIITNDDAKAFSHAVHSDQKHIVRFVLQAYTDYQRSAQQAGVVTGLENGPTTLAHSITESDMTSCCPVTVLILCSLLYSQSSILL